MYDQVIEQAGTADAARSTLQVRTVDGWELVAAMNHQNYITMFFRRPRNRAGPTEDSSTRPYPHGYAAPRSDAVPRRYPIGMNSPPVGKPLRAYYADDTMFIADPSYDANNELRWRVLSGGDIDPKKVVSWSYMIVGDRIGVTSHVSNLSPYDGQRFELYRVSGETAVGVLEYVSDGGWKLTSDEYRVRPLPEADAQQQARLKDEDDQRYGRS